MSEIMDEGGDCRLVEPKSESVAHYAPSTGRRNLIVMRAGNKALFPEWKPAQDRSWDIAISFYGEGQPEWGQEYFLPAKGPKFPPIHAFLSANPGVFERYDYIWFPDDDIMTTWSNVDDLFQVMRDFDLQLAQPALTPESFISHAVTRKDPACLLRFTIFVEVMAPLFRSDALKLCLPVMAEPTRYGWGHDWIYPMLLGYPKNKIAIIDACAVTHTRPAGATTDFGVARAELFQIVTKFGARFMDHRVQGRISLHPEPGYFAEPGLFAR